MRPSESDLRNWYVTERKSTRVIAAEIGVSHMSVKRWLRAYGIHARPQGRGLANREIDAPSAAELRRLIHEDHLGYRGVASIYGVDPSAVMHWLRRHGIKRPTVWQTRYGNGSPVLPPADQLAELYNEGLSLEEIGARFGVTRLPVVARMKAAGIPIKPDGWSSSRIVCTDGHRVRSTYEVRVCEWLTSHAIAHTYEPSYPFDKRMHADFLASGQYIEIWGVVSDPAYTARRARKVESCRTHGLPLLEISAHHFGRQRNTWLRLLDRCFIKASDLPSIAVSSLAQESR